MIPLHIDNRTICSINPRRVCCRIKDFKSREDLQILANSDHEVDIVCEQSIYCHLQIQFAVCSYILSLVLIRSQLPKLHFVDDLLLSASTVPMAFFTRE